jgi:hypothetical protein
MKDPPIIALQHANFALRQKFHARDIFIGVIRANAEKRCRIEFVWRKIPYSTREFVAANKRQKTGRLAINTCRVPPSINGLTPGALTTVPACSFAACCAWATMSSRQPTS